MTYGSSLPIIVRSSTIIIYGMSICLLHDETDSGLLLEYIVNALPGTGAFSLICTVMGNIWVAGRSLQGVFNQLIEYYSVIRFVLIINMK